MNADVATIKNSLRQFSGACHRVAQDPQLHRDPNMKLDLGNIYKNDLAEAIQAMQYLVTVMKNGANGGAG